ncbi:MAG TPA: hypothetical protein VH120_06900 [Gemmataceae bacterium]|nr:hypothetical protein [Gemmataceae bacterium]
MNRPLGFILFLILATVVGCGQQDKKYANVKGKVTYNGQPIEKGQITFWMEGGPPSSMNIVDGEFNGQAMVGSNKVSVSAKKKSASAPKLPPNAQIQIDGYKKKFQAEQGKGAGSISDYDATMVEYIPPEWGTESKETRVVESGSTNEFEFNIKGKN